MNDSWLPASGIDYRYTRGARFVRALSAGPIGDQPAIGRKLWIPATRREEDRFTSERRHDVNPAAIFFRSKCYACAIRRESWVRFVGGIAGKANGLTAADLVKPGSLLLYGDDRALLGLDLTQPGNWTDYRFSVYARSTAGGAWGTASLSDAVPGLSRSTTRPSVPASSTRRVSR